MGAARVRRVARLHERARDQARQDADHRAARLPVKVAFVVNDLQLSGGVGVVVEHARQLVRRHGVRGRARARARRRTSPTGASRASPTSRCTAWSVARATRLRRRRRHLVGDGRAGARARRARRHAYFVQSLEDRFYRRGEPQRLAAALTHDLPLPVITEARWIAETLEALTPERRCLLVRNGIAKDVFAPAGGAAACARDEPLRILIEGNPACGSRASTRRSRPRARCSEPRARDRGHARTARKLRRRRRRASGRSRQRELAAAYADADVVLKLSRVEGMFGPPLEGFHMGATCVVTRGHRPRGVRRARRERARRRLGRRRAARAARSTCWPATARSCTACAGARWRPRAAGRRGSSRAR